MQAVILAAGRGSRLHPITADRSKAMCPIAGKPMVARVMDVLRANGASKFILVTSPQDAEIAAYFAGSTTVRLVTQTPPLGMGHALKQAAPYIEGDFFLSACDNLVSERAIEGMLRMWLNLPSPNGVLALLRVSPPELTRMGMVEMQDLRVTRIIEKPGPEAALSNLGSIPLYLFTPRLLDYLEAICPSPRGEYELQDAIQTLIEREGEVFGYLVPERIDLTRPADLLRLNLQFLKNGQIHPRHIETGTRFISPVLIEEGAQIGANCLIGPGVFIENGARLGDGVIIEHSVVLRGAKIGQGMVIRNEVIG